MKVGALATMLLGLCDKIEGTIADFLILRFGDFLLGNAKTKLLLLSC